MEQKLNRTKGCGILENQGILEPIRFEVADEVHAGEEVCINCFVLDTAVFIVSEDGDLCILCCSFHRSGTCNLPGKAVFTLGQGNAAARRQLYCKVAAVVAESVAFIDHGVVDVLPFALFIAIVDSVGIDDGLVQSVAQRIGLAGAGSFGFQLLARKGVDLFLTEAMMPRLFLFRHSISPCCFVLLCWVMREQVPQALP